MKKPENNNKDNIWNETQDTEQAAPLSVEPDLMPESTEELKPQAKPRLKIKYSLAGLKADFPTAKELEQFVFDETQVSLKLKGIDPEQKYKIALAVLNNEEIDPAYLTTMNPYVDNQELVPEDPVRAIPQRDPRLPNTEPMNIYHDFTVPHPDKDMRALDAKVVCQFKTYDDGSISYEILGPLEKHAVGEKLDKYGRARPEKFVWVDPRTGEQAIRYRDGSYTRMGQRLRTLMESKRVNKEGSIWTIWIDRDFTQFNQDKIENPWET